MISLHLIMHIEHNENRKNKHQKSYDLHIIALIARVGIAQKTSLFRVIEKDISTEIQFAVLRCATSLIHKAFVGEVKHWKKKVN